MSEIPVVQITDLAFGGKGVARHGGMVVFVPFTAPGDTVAVEITKKKKTFAEGRATRVLSPGPDRVTPPCQYFGECGGCAYQHLRYEAQLAAKSSQVEQTLRRVGKLTDVPMQPMIGSPNPYGYRNRIRVHRVHGVTGFFGHESRELVDIAQCLIAEPAVNKALQRLRNSKVEDGDYSLRAPGGGGPFFEQVNEAVTRLLVELLDRTLRSGQQLLVDTYCGGGRFAHALAGHAEKVIGIETSAAAIEYARKQAGPGESYAQGDVADHLGDVLAAHDAARTSVILDPPPEGVGPRVLDLLLAAAPSEIAYVSCNPATLARDLAALTKAYRLTAVTPLDMFAQTAEIEVCAHLVRNDA
jgi:23S rRNA (uracil1939-C5)-methyltransferase